MQQSLKRFHSQLSRATHIGQLAERGFAGFRIFTLALTTLVSAVSSAQSVSKSSNVSMWGLDDYHEAELPSNIGNVVQLSFGTFHSAALLDNGTVVCWGVPPAGYDYGQAQVPPSLPKASQVVAGRDSTLVLLRDGTLVKWGINDGSVPTGLNHVIQIAAGDFEYLALKSDGTVVEWGLNSSKPPSGLSHVVQIDDCVENGVALRSDGTVVVWGDNSEGQCSVPGGLKNVVQVRASYHGVMALTKEGRVVCWGDNYAGKANVPSGLPPIRQIASGFETSYALADDGTLFAWGDNTYGQRTIPKLSGGILQISARSWCVSAFKKFYFDTTLSSMHAGDVSQETVRLGAAPGNSGFDLLLTSSDPSVSVPAKVHFNAGSLSASFSVTGNAHPTPPRVTITAAAGSDSDSTGLNIFGSAPSIELSNSSVVGGSTTPITLRYWPGNPPSVQTNVKLSGQSSLLSFPTLMTVPIGARSASVSIEHRRVRAPSDQPITAEVGGHTYSDRLRLDPIALTLTTDREIWSGTTGSGAVTLNAAFSTSTTVNLSVAPVSVLTFASTVTIPVNTRNAQFSITAGNLTTSVDCSLSASTLYAPASSTSILTVQPRPYFATSAPRTSPGIHRPAGFFYAFTVTATLSAPIKVPTTITISSSDGGKSTSTFGVGQTSLYLSITGRVPQSRSVTVTATCLSNKSVSTTIITGK